MNKNFGGVIWTNHALDRLKERNIKQEDALATFNKPDQSRLAATKGAFIYFKTYANERLEVVASKNEKGQWVIMTVWNRPIFEKSKRVKYHGSFWDNMLEGFLQKIFRKK